MLSPAIRTFSGVLIALVFVAAFFITAACVYKVARERIRADSQAEFTHFIRRYTDGMELRSPGEWRSVKSEQPLLRLSAVTAAWFTVATAAALLLWRLLSPSRTTIRSLAISEILVVFVLVAVFTCLKPYQRERIRIFLGPSRDPLASGYPFRLRERFVPRWSVTGAVTVMVAGGALPALFASHTRRAAAERKRAS